LSTRLQRIIRPAGARLLIAFTTSFAGCGGSGDGGIGSANSKSMISIAGTAATGKALANATVSIFCARGSMSVTADANGSYHPTLGTVMPCVITATSGATTLHSAAFAGGTYNVTSETDLLLPYLAAQLGANESALIAGFAANTAFEQALQTQTMFWARRPLSSRVCSKHTVSRFPHPTS
jgi:hypothetical protein